MNRIIIKFLYLFVAFCIPYQATIFSQNQEIDREISSLFSTANRLEGQNQFKEAYGIYQKILEKPSTSRLFSKAKTRAIWLEQRKDGNWLPLKELKEIQKRGIPTEDSLEEFESKIQDFPSSLIKKEAMQYVASSWMQLKNHTKAIKSLERWLAEPNIKNWEKKRIARKLVVAHAWTGNQSAVETIINKYQIVDTEFVKEIYRVQQRPLKKWVSILTLLLTFIFGFVFGGSEILKKTGVIKQFPLKKWLIVTALLSFPMVVASVYDHEAAEPFQKLFVGTWVLWTYGAIVSLGFSKNEKWKNKLRKPLSWAMMGLFFCAHMAVAYLSFETYEKIFGFKW